MSYLWAKIIKVLNHFSLIFQKTMIKDCFKLFVLDFDMIMLELTYNYKFYKVLIPEWYQHSSCN